MRKHIAALALPCLLLAFGGARAEVKKADPDEELLRQAGIATDDAGLRKYLRDCAAYDAKVRRIPALIRQLGAKEFREREKASAELISIGLGALPALLNSTEDKDPEIARRVKSCVQQLCGKDEAVLSLIKDKQQIAICLFDTFAKERFSCGTREIALRYLLRQGKEREFVAAFVDCLQSPDNQFLLLVDRVPGLARDVHVSRMAEDLLDRAAPKRFLYLRFAPSPNGDEDWSPTDLQALRPKVRLIMDFLYRSAESPDADRRASAGKALNRLGREKSTAAIKYFHEAKVPSTRAWALEQLGCWLFAKEEAPVLVEALKDKNRAVREVAAGKLGWMVLRAELAVTALIAALQDDSEAVRVCAAASFSVFGGDAKAAIPALLRTLKNGGAELRWLSACSLGRIGPHDPGVVPALVEALRDPDARFGAVQGIFAIGAAAKAAVPALVEIARNPGPEKPSDPHFGATPCALEAIASIGREAKEAVPALVDMLRNDRTNIEIRNVVARTLGHIGPPASPAVPVLVKILGENRKGYLEPNTILQILGQIGPGARSAIPHLIAIGRDAKESLKLRSMAGLALEKIAPGAGKKILEEVKAIERSQYRQPPKRGLK